MSKRCLVLLGCIGLLVLPIASLLATASGGSAVFSLQADEAIGTGGAGNYPHRFAYAPSFGSGTSAGQIDRAWSVRYQPSSSASTTYDVRSLTDQDGTPITFAKIVCLGFSNEGTTAIEVGGAASNALLAMVKDTSDILTIPAGARVLYCNDTGVSTGSGNKDLKVLNTSGSTAGDIRIYILGRSA